MENFKELTAQWLDEEQQIWKNVIDNAISTGEINANVDSSVLSHMFEDCYLGNAFKGVFSYVGYDVGALHQEFNQIYELLKK